MTEGVVSESSFLRGNTACQLHDGAPHQITVTSHRDTITIAPPKGCRT